MKIDKITSFFILCISCLCGTVSAWGQQNKVVENFLRTKGFEHASIGISIRRMTDGKSLIFWQEEQSLIPASTQKVITTATALNLLGPDYRIPTIVGYSGRIEHGVLKGDLIIRGSGDPSLGSKYSKDKKDSVWMEVLRALRKVGITRIEGRIIGDEMIFDREGIQPGWSWEDMGNYYAAGIYGLNYADNMFELILDTSHKGKRPVVKQTVPDIPDLTVHNYLLAKGMSYDSAYLYGAPFSNERFLYGAVPQKNKEFIIKGDMPEPALQTAQALHAYLVNAGVFVKEIPASGRMLDAVGLSVPPVNTVLVKHLSEPLSVLVRQTNVYSINLFAEGILRQIALKNGDGSAGMGINRILAYWNKQGVAAGGLFLYDGSGLSPANRVTADFMTSLMLKMKDNTCFVESLPLVGLEGTVGGFLASTSYKGKARLKSGTIKQVIGYTGYIEGKEKYAITIIVNNAISTNRETRRAIEKFLVELDL